MSTTNHNVSFDADDPRVSAYALGELSDRERAEFEAQVLAAGPQAQAALDQAVREVRQAGDLLARALASEPSPTLERELSSPPASSFAALHQAPRPSSSLQSSSAQGPGVAAPTRPLSKEHRMSVSRMVLAASVLIAVFGGGLLLFSPAGSYSPVAATFSAGEPQSDAREYAKGKRASELAPASVRTYDWAPAPESKRPERMEEFIVRNPAISQTPPPPKSLPPLEQPAEQTAGRPLDADEGRPPEGVAGEGYNALTENDFFRVSQEPLSTFSIDVDTASYSNMRRMLKDNGILPPAASVRIEEFLNYFAYDYAGPKDDAPFAAHLEVGGCPWHNDHRLVRIALKGKEIPREQRPLSNLVFLLDVSGSMNAPLKLPLVRESMKVLVDQLGENDRVAIVVYAGASGLALPSTTCERKSDIFNALDRLAAGGSTAGGAGIQLAYDVAVQNFIKGGTNRVILCTDGDFNVGPRSQDELKALIQEKAKTGVFLSVFGFGMGNLQDNILETLADKGNGSYAYIDSLNESKKVFVEQLTGTLITIAKDVKIQIEFNPGRVVGYRLLGYENRILAHQDFRDDKKDAGEIGAGHTVTALYEIVPVGKDLDTPGVDKLKYQKKPQPTDAADSEDLLTLKLRYKQPDADQSTLREFSLTDSGKSFGQASEDFKWATAVASYAMMLRNSKYAGNSTFASILEIAESAKGQDKSGYRAEFIELVKRAKALRGN